MTSTRVLGTRPVFVHSSRTLGYDLETGSHHVTRTEEEIKAFHRSIVDKLLGVQKNATKKDVEARLDFPLKEFKTGLEMIPGLVFIGALYGGVKHAEMEVAPAAGFALALSSLVMLFVMTLGMARLPVTWAGTKRMAPVEKYLARVKTELEMVGLGDNYRALVEAPQVHDWPSRLGDIDLTIQDLPHESAATEWWYYNAHVLATSSKSTHTKRLSFFASFFRVIKHVDEQGNTYHGHALTWAISDPETGAYHSDVVLEGDAPKVILGSMEKGEAWVSDSFVRRALMDVLRKGNVPLPDRLMRREPVVSTSSLSLDLDGSSLIKDETTGEYVLSVRNAMGDCGGELRFAPEKCAVRHGDHGVVKGHDGEGQDMFYYFIPRCGVSGWLLLPESPGTGVKYEIHGQGWYDHEFGGMINKPPALTESSSSLESGNKEPKEKPKREKMDYAWNWIAAQLDDGTDVTAAVLLDPRAKRVIETKAVIVSKDGSRSQFDESSASLTEVPNARWTSVRTFKTYPVEFRLVVGGTAQMDLTIKASFNDQEFMTILSKPAFWEGRCDVFGTVQGRRVSGLAYLERNGFDPDQSLSSFFKNVGVAVRDSVEACYPLQPTQDQAVQLFASKETKHYMDDVPLEVLGDKLIGPVRMIADRGGKSWRSYAALACVDAVGGDSRRFVKWTALPEMLHVGSLIVDDIQDRSASRRGGPAAHHVYGEPLCINAGTAAYFECEQLLDVPELTDEQRVKCYRLYFLALRAGHAGQCLDINGNDYMMDQVVETGDARLLEKRILAIHRLKTAAPAGTLARLGSTVGGGSEAQIDAIGRFMEAVGVAFQIMDDVLNLRGVVAKASDKLKAGTLLKTLGEDIMEGKITYPVAKFLGKCKNVEERRRVWNIIKSKPQDQNIVHDLIADFEKVEAIDDCVSDANRVIDEAWEVMDREIPDSFAKVMLRSFAFYVTQN